MNGNLIYMMGVVALVIGTICIYWGSHIKATKFENELKSKNDEIAGLAKENASLTKENLSTITGGDSFPYIMVTKNALNNNEINFDLVHEGEFPLYDLAVTITDHDAASKAMKVIEVDGKKVMKVNREQFEKQIKIGNLPPNHVISEFIKFTLSDDAPQERNFTIRISARNGSYYQPIKITKDKDGKVKFNYHIEKDKVILKEVKMK